MKYKRKTLSTNYATDNLKLQQDESSQRGNEARDQKMNKLTKQNNVRTRIKQNTDCYPAYLPSLLQQIGMKLVELSAAHQQNITCGLL